MLKTRSNLADDCRPYLRTLDSQRLGENLDRARKSALLVAESKCRDAAAPGIINRIRDLRKTPTQLGSHWLLQKEPKES